MQTVAIHHRTILYIFGHVDRLEGLPMGFGRRIRTVIGLIHGKSSMDWNAYQQSPRGRVEWRLWSTWDASNFHASQACVL